MLDVSPRWEKASNIFLSILSHCIVCFIWHRLQIIISLPENKNKNKIICSEAEGGEAIVHISLTHSDTDLTVPNNSKCLYEDSIGFFAPGIYFKVLLEVTVTVLHEGI